MKNFKCIVAYNGTNFCGSQRQINQRTVQGEIEKAIKFVTGEDVKLAVAGRTDSGVHASGQVINFKSSTFLSCHALTKLLNRQLPTDVQIQNIELVDDKFHSRFSAKSKTYKYCFYCSKEINPIIDNIALNINFQIDITKMKKAASYLIGSNDFKCFMATGSNVKDTVRTIYSSEITQQDNVYIFTITGNAFLYNMVRIIVGTLLKVGDGTYQPEDILTFITNGTRPRVKTASAKGLTLYNVEY